MSKQKISWRVYFIELLVVIIGITIAFALEGWSKANNDQKLEVSYLESIRSDLTKDKNDMADVLDSSEVITSYVSETFQFLYGNQNLELFKRHHITSTYTPPYFYANNGTYISLLNSGDLNLIRDFGLKSGLADLYNISYKEVERVDGVIRKLVDDLLYPYMIKHIKFSGSRDGIDDYAPLKQNEAINMLGSYFNFLGSRKEAYTKLRIEIDQILDKIEIQLKELQ